MSDFTHLRHKPLAKLDRPRELIIACCPLRSNVNLSKIVRTASCCGVARVIACGRPKLDPEITRDGIDQIEVESHRSLAPVLKRLRSEGYQIVGLEQSTNSESIHHFQ